MLPLFLFFNGICYDLSKTSVVNKFTMHTDTNNVLPVQVYHPLSGCIAYEDWDILFHCTTYCFGELLPVICVESRFFGNY